MISPHRNNKKRRGAAAVEFAIVLPLLVIILLGMWEFGRIIQVQQMMSTAAREAGREASTGNYSHAQILDFAKSSLTQAGLSTQAVNNATISITNVSSGEDAKSADQLDHFSITIALRYSDVRWSPADLIVGPSATLTTSAHWYSMKDVPLLVNTEIPLQ